MPKAAENGLMSDTEATLICFAQTATLNAIVHSADYNVFHECSRARSKALPIEV